MKLYQIEHNKYDDWDDNFTFREDTVYTNKYNLIKDILNSEYELTTNGSYKKKYGGYYHEIDVISITELDVVDNKVGAWNEYVQYDKNYNRFLEEDE